jgi:hypothetical protein
MDDSTTDNASRFASHEVNRPQAEAMQVIRDTLHAAADIICENVPHSRERSLAITKLEEAMFHANAGVARLGVASRAIAPDPAPAADTLTNQGPGFQG